VIRFSDLFTRRRKPAAGTPLLLGLALIYSVTTGVLVPGPAAAAEPISLEEITPGMKGYGLSVFAGSRIDTFGVEVIGVQANTRAAGSLILIRVNGQGLEVSRVVQGMSGSPIFLEGRFAGALAFGWAGSLDPIAGVTPAGEILALPTDVPRQSASRRGAGLVVPSELVSNRTGFSGLAEELEDFFPLRESHRSAVSSSVSKNSAQIKFPAGWPAPGDLIQSMLPGLFSASSAAGFGPGSWICQPLESRLTGSRSGAASTSNGPTRALSPGSSCAIPLITGDAQLGAIGTVTWVQDEHVFMMGHPFMQRGPVNLPLATADILTVLPSRNMSFKMGSIGPVVGAVHHDQRAGLSGRLGDQAPMIPVEVTVQTIVEPATGQTTNSETYRFAVVDDPLLTPSLVFWALYNSLLVEGDDASLQTVEYELETTWSGSGSLADRPLVLNGIGSGPGGVGGLGGQWMMPLMMMLNNPHEPVALQSVRAVLRVKKDLKQARIVGLTGPRTVARAGGEVVYRVEIEPRLGESRIIEFPLTLPEHLPAGPYRVVVASAAEFFALEAQRAAGRFEVKNLADTVALLESPRSPNTLVLTVLAPGRGLVLEGKEMSSLPRSVRRILRSGDPQAGATLADYMVRREKELPWALQGHAILELNLPTDAESRPEERRP
jgi:SpoIVB peptidase S55